MTEQERREMSYTNLTIEKAPDGLGTKNCVVVSEGYIPKTEDFFIAAGEISGMAVKNEAYQEDVDDAPDDQYAVKFPGEEPRLYTHDELSAKLRNLNEEGGE